MPFLRIVLVGVTFGCLVGCSSGDGKPVAGQTVRSQPPTPKVSAKTLSQPDVMNGLERAGLVLTPLDKTYVYPSDLQKFPAEPRAMFSIRVGDGKGNSETMTLLEFSSAGQVAGVRGVNGFPVHNWFFLGIISNQWRDIIVSALG